MFGILEDILDNAKLLDETEAWFFVIDRELQDEIVRLNTQDQLYEDGIDSLNRKLGGDGKYSPYTITLKRQKGQRVDHITLKDTGAFYNSFKVTVNSRGFTIVADDKSHYDVPLTDDFGIDILGLTEDNKSWLYDFLIDKYLEYVERKLLPKY